MGGSGGPEPTAGDTALRDGLAKVLAPMWPITVVRNVEYHRGQILAAADALMPVVQAALAEQTQQVRAQTLREAADLLDSKALHCEEHGSVTCTECPVGSDHLRIWADRIDRPEGTQRDTEIRWEIGKGGLR